MVIKMKLLMFHAKEFWFSTFKKILEDVKDVKKEERIEEAEVIFIHTEKKDEERKNKVIRNAVKTIKWIVKKVNVSNIVLHPFVHLSNSKSSPEFAQEVIQTVKDKLTGSSLKIYETPFGYMNEFKIHVYGESLGKVFKDI
jgi:hypothetical protein